mmetsp:Transcript_8141/g.27332  ORF Transcript_8141/g.27332 Transcript_8141/m.27332 type:complete len:94 (+) Transcript_8141:1859-2140(+)
MFWITTLRREPRMKAKKLLRMKMEGEGEEIRTDCLFENPLRHGMTKCSIRWKTKYSNSDFLHRFTSFYISLRSYCMSNHAEAVLVTVFTHSTL